MKTTKSVVILSGGEAGDEGSSQLPYVWQKNKVVRVDLHSLQVFGSGRCRGPYFLVAEQESKQRSQLRGGVDRKAFLFVVTSLSCGGPTLSHPPLRTPPGPRRYLAARRFP